MDGQYVGIDLHRRRSVIVRMDSAGEVLDEVRIDNDPLALAAEVAKAGPHPEVVVEAAFGWYWAVDLLEEMGARVHLAHPLGIKAFETRRVKNDRLDAKLLADLLRMGRLPEAWIAPKDTRELRELVRYRHKLVDDRAGRKAQIHAVLAKEGVRFNYSNTLGLAATHALGAAELGAVYRHRVDSLQDLAGVYDREISVLDQLIYHRLDGHTGYRAIKAIPGVGPVLGAVFVAEIGDVSRFSGPDKLCSWAGLTPRHRESDAKVHRGRITKMGMWGGRPTGGPDRLHQEVSMTVTGGLDIHRAQLTFDYVDRDTGEVQTGKIAPANRLLLRRWLERFADMSDVEFALEGCTGWRYVVEELSSAGVVAHLAEPAETASLRGKKSKAKTDKADARHLRQLLVDGRVPESWIPPAEVLDARVLVRLYKDLVDERTGWLQRVHAILFHHGVPAAEGSLTTERGRAALVSIDVPPAARYGIDTGMRQVDRLSAEMLPLRKQIVAIGTRQPGCKALQAHYGIGSFLSVAIWEELGDCRRFTSSDDAVRHAGLDVTVWSSDGKRTRGHLAKQGPPVLRWALYEAAVYAARATSPDYPYYQQLRRRLEAHLALITVARKLARRCYHTLRAVGEVAYPATA